MTQHNNLDMRDILLNFDYTNDINVNYIPKTRSLGDTKAYLSIEDMAQLSNEVNDAAVILMTFYFRKVTHPKYDFFDDEAVAKALHWNQSKTKKTRLALVKAGWIKKITYVQPTTKAKTTTFFLGKEACSKIETPEEFTARVKATDAKRAKLISHFGCESWEEVTAKYSEEEIISVNIELNQS